MDRFLKRLTPAVDTSSVNSNPSKKPKPSAKQGDVSAAFRAQEFGRNFYDSGGKMFCKPCNTVVDHTRKSVAWSRNRPEIRLNPVPAGFPASKSGSGSGPVSKLFAGF